MERAVIGQQPFPHAILDGAFDVAQIARAAADWPKDDWPGWVRYDGRAQDKRASDLQTPLPPSCAELLRLMSRVPVEWLFDAPDLVPDLGLYGAGLHESETGHGVSLHLDADRHARLALQRVLSGALYVHSRWESEWGGELELWHADRSAASVRIAPLPGRLVIFDARGAAYHRVASVKAPEGIRRQSLAMFWYGRVS